MNAPNSKTSHNRLRFEREVRGWSQEDLAEKVGTTQKIVSRWERGESTPLPYYRQKLCTILGKNAAELGLIDQEETNPVSGLSTEEQANDGSGIPHQAPSLQHTDAHLDGNRSVRLIIPNGTPHSVTIHIYQHGSFSNSLMSEVHGIIDGRGIKTSEQEPSGGIEQIVKRREFIQEGLRIVGTTALAPYNLINDELVERFVRALKKPSSIDERTLHYFELRTMAYWQDRHSAALASGDLLSYVIEHLQRVFTLLEGTLLPTTRTRLCCIASGIAQLAGHLLFDMGEFVQARKFHHIAITAAQEGNDQPLEAVAWGRMSFTWTYSGNTPEALLCIQEARHLAAGTMNTNVQAYLAAVEAEIQAIRGSAQSCLEALKIAECVEDRQYPREEMYWLHFDRSRLAGYQGICFRRLYHTEDARTYFFLAKAQRALTDALALLDPGRIQRRPILLIDLACTYTQEGDIVRACEHAAQAMSIMAQTKSHTVAERLLKLRQELEPWKNTHHVKKLDQQMREQVTSRGF